MGLETAVVSVEIPSSPRRGSRWPIGLLLSIGSALMMVLALQYYAGLWFLAFLALVPAIVASYRFMPSRLSGLPMGIAWLGYWGWWAYISEQIAPMPIPVVVGLLFFIFGVLITAFDRRLSERTGYRWFLLQLPVTWVAFDVLYQTNLFIGDEGQYASLLAPFPLLLQPISIVGEVGLTFWLVLVNCTIALAVMRVLDRRDPPVDSVAVSASVVKRTAAIGTIVSLVWVVAALLLWQQVGSAQGPAVRVGAVQVGPGTGFSPDGTGEDTPEVHRQLAKLTREAADQGAEWVVWPEDILHFDPRTDPRRLVQRTARQTQTYIQTGFTVGQPSPEATNMTGLWGPDGRLVGVYYKIHPVVMVGEDFKQPERYAVFDTTFGVVGMIICFDFSFEEPTRLMVRNGAQIMGASVGDWSRFGPVRIQTVQMRAVENQVPYVKSEMLNGSALVDARGNVVDSAVMGSDGGEAVLVADLPLGPRGAVYTWLGPMFGYLTVVLLVIRIVAQVTLSVRARRHATPTAAPERAD